MVNAFQTASGIEIPYQIVDRRQGDIACCYADPALAAEELGWRAELGVDAMCSDAWRWQSTNLNGYDVQYWYQSAGRSLSLMALIESEDLQ